MLKLLPWQQCSNSKTKIGYPNNSLKVHCEEYKLRNIHAEKQQLVRIKDTLLPSIIDHFCCFTSSVAPIYESFACFIDHHRWDSENMQAECYKEIKTVAPHFSTLLKKHMFNLDH